MTPLQAAVYFLVLCGCAVMLMLALRDLRDSTPVVAGMAWRFGRKVVAFVILVAAAVWAAIYGLGLVTVIKWSRSRRLLAVYQTALYPAEQMQHFAGLLWGGGRYGETENRREEGRQAPDHGTD